MLRPDVSGITDVKPIRESGCRLVHRYRIYRDSMPHVCLQDGVIRKLLAFVHRPMAIAQLTHLHLTVPSSGTTSGLVHPDSFPGLVHLASVQLTQKPVGPNKVSPPLSPPGEEPNSPGEAQDSPDDTSQHVRDHHCTSDL